MNFNGERTNSYRFSAAYRAFTGRILQRCRELRKRKAHICEGGCAPPKSFRKLVLPVYSADMHVFSHSLARHAVWHTELLRSQRFQGGGTGVPPVRIVQPTHGRDARATTV